MTDGCICGIPPLAQRQKRAKDGAPSAVLIPGTGHCPPL